MMGLVGGLNKELSNQLWSGLGGGLGLAGGLVGGLVPAFVGGLATGLAPLVMKTINFVGASPLGESNLKVKWSPRCIPWWMVNSNHPSVITQLLWGLLGLCNAIGVGNGSTWPASVIKIVWLLILRFSHKSQNIFGSTITCSCSYAINAFVKKTIHDVLLIVEYFNVPKSFAT